MALWTDLMDSATLTGYARESFADHEARNGTLARWLPNREVADISVRFAVGQSGLVPEAQFRAFDAEPDIGKGEQAKRTTVDLLALGQNVPVTEYQQLRVRNASDDSMVAAILSATNVVVRSIADRIERLRGTVLTTGRATVDQANFANDDDFGRDPGMTFTAPALWSAAGTDRLTQIQTWTDLYRDTNGEDPGCLVMSTRAIRALASGTQFQTQLLNGGSRPSTESDMQAIIAGAGLPQIVRFDRRTSAGKVLADDRVLVLPAPVDPNAWESTQLGATFWGQTLTSTDPSYQIADSDQPGIVVGTYRNEKPPMIAEVISDAIALPVLANANLSMSVKVL